MSKRQLTTRGVAELLSRSPHWVHMNANRLGIPRYRIGGTWVYKEDEVNAWYLDQKEQSSAVRFSRKNPMKVVL